MWTVSPDEERSGGMMNRKVTCAKCGRIRRIQDTVPRSRFVEDGSKYGKQVWEPHCTAHGWGLEGEAKSLAKFDARQVQATA